MIKSKKYLKLCDCKDSLKSKQVCLALYENPSMDESIVIGRIEVECCPRCLAKQAWVNIARKLAIFFIIFLTTLIGFWLFGEIVPLAWVGGLIILIGLIVYLFINLYGSVREEEINGAAHCLKRLINSRGSIEPSDFFWLTETGKSIILESDYSLDHIIFLSTFALKNTDNSYLLNLLPGILSHASRDIISEPLYIRKAFCKPIVIGLLITISIFLTYLFVNIAFELQSLTILLVGIVMMITLISSLVLLLVKKSYIGYIPILFCLIYIWAVGAMIWNDQLAKNLDKPLVLTLLLLIPALCYIPYLNKEL